jgi:hypothetical protein
MKVIIGSSSSNIKKILLINKFSDNKYKCVVENNHKYPDTFKTWFKNNYLYVQRIDTNTGWGHKHIGNIIENTHLKQTIQNRVIQPTQDGIIPKIIYFTYKTNPPKYVFDKWKILNPDYIIDFSLDDDCINFLNNYFDETFSKMFNEIKEGMYKADLWRLCKLYINGGVYADIDLVPYVSIDDLIKDKYTFYSCLSADKHSIFQAFIVTPPKNPLILSFIFSFIQNRPYNYGNGPTYDMYNVINDNLNYNNREILSEKIYNLDSVKIKLNIRNNNTNIKTINLYNFPLNFEYNIEIINQEFPDTFNFKIENNKLIIVKTNDSFGWKYNYSIYIHIKTNQSIFLFTEKYTDGHKLDSVYVTWNNNKIFKCRYTEYIKIKEKNIEWI